MPRAPQETSPSLLRRLVRGVWRTMLTGLVVAGSIAAIMLGFEALAARAAANAPDGKAALIPVAARAVSHDEGFALTREFIGQIEAQQSVNLSFELGGKLQAISVDEGDSVTKGQVLARLDTRLIEADRDRLLASQDAIAAQLAFADQTLERARELNTRGFASTERLDQALSRQTELSARIAEIAAGLERVALQLEKSVLIAPSDGRITTRLVDGGETLGSGQVILGLVEDSRTLVRVGLPLSIDLAEIERVEIEIDGTHYPATLESERPDVDAVTRTRTVLFAMETNSPMTLGQTAALHLQRFVDVPGIWVPTRLLSEAARGTWSLMVLDDDNIVRRALVEVVHARGDEVYVRGTFAAGTRLITKGPQRVTPGQSVIVEGEG